MVGDDAHARCLLTVHCYTIFVVNYTTLCVCVKRLSCLMRRMCVLCVCARHVHRPTVLCMHCGVCVGAIQFFGRTTYAHVSLLALLMYTISLSLLSDYRLNNACVFTRHVVVRVIIRIEYISAVVLTNTAFCIDGWYRLHGIIHGLLLNRSLLAYY